MVEHGIGKMEEVRCKQIGTLTGGVWDKMHEQSRRVYDKSGLSNTLTSVQKDNYVLEPQYRIRKLTPLECLRLMGFDDEDYKKLKAIGMSDSQIYRQAGNSIVVQVLEEIFKQML